MDRGVSTRRVVTRRTNKLPASLALVDMDVELRVRAYSMGYIAGTTNAVHGGTKGRTVVEPATHAHWRVGFEDGKQAVGNAADAYRERLKKENEHG